MGGDLGESIPKGIDVGLCEALVKSKQPVLMSASLHGRSRLPRRKLGGRISQGAAPPKPATSQTACLKLRSCMTYNFADPPECYFRSLVEVRIEITWLTAAV